MYKWSIYTWHKLLIVLKISFILVIYWYKNPLSCYFTIWTQQLKNQIFLIKTSWRYLCIWTGYWYRNINKAMKRLEKQVLIDLRQKARILILIVPRSNWLWTLTADPVWHFSHQNVPKYIKVSCYSFNMNIMENIPHALDVYAQRALKYDFTLIYDFTIIETGGLSVV